MHGSFESLRTPNVPTLLRQHCLNSASWRQESWSCSYLEWYLIYSGTPGLMVCIPITKKIPIWVQWRVKWWRHRSIWKCASALCRGIDPLSIESNVCPCRSTGFKAMAWPGVKAFEHFWVSGFSLLKHEDECLAAYLFSPSTSQSCPWGQMILNRREARPHTSVPHPHLWAPLPILLW